MSASPKTPRLPVEVAVTHFKWDHGRGVSFSAPHRHQALLRRLVGDQFQKCAEEGHTCVRVLPSNLAWHDAETDTFKHKLVLCVTWGSCPYDPMLHRVLSKTATMERHDAL